MSAMTRKRIGFGLGLALFVGINLLDLEPGNPAATRMASIAALMAVWWITEAIPLFATSLLPIVSYPLLGVMSGRETAPIYINSVIFLFIGGFIIALAMERWNLHRRIALTIITSLGGGPARIVLGFMLASAFLSMWISNTATAVMMTPIALAILGEMEEAFGKERSRAFSLALLLGVAYACSVGGIATLVGTPPNLSLARIYEMTFPDAEPLSFGPWLLLGLPVSATMLLVIWALLTKVFFRFPSELTIDSAVLRKEKDALGPMRFEEAAVLVVFVVTAFLWVFRKPLTVGGLVVPGWSGLLPFPGLIDDGTVAMGMALLLFVLPSRDREHGHATLAGADTVKKLPWHIVLLFGGGFALAKGLQTSGLSALIGEQAGGLGAMPPFVLVLVLCLGMTFLTELTSNLATTEMIQPILASVAVTIGMHPLVLMVPAAISASCAFMMPVATPPNAIVFGSERIRIADMARVGVFINLIGALVVSTIFFTIGMHVLGIDPAGTAGPPAVGAGE